MWTAVVYFGNHHGQYVEHVTWREAVEFLARFSVVDKVDLTKEET